ncbi:hypothetical protein [Actinomyces sp. ZJ308]|nr:hypothetical protein [Actinomyces sp. ZJ308]
MSQPPPSGFAANDAVELGDQEDIDQIEEEHDRVHRPVRDQ